MLFCIISLINNKLSVNSLIYSYKVLLFAIFAEIFSLKQNFKVGVQTNIRDEYFQTETYRSTSRYLL